MINEKKEYIAEAQDTQSPSRLMASAALDAAIQALLRRAQGLTALRKALPLELPKDAEEALWELLAGIR